MKKIKNRSFKCLNCGKGVTVIGHIGTAHRNHCPYCLWSKHVDEFQEGDRKSFCQAGMEPIGLTFKKEKPDKYHPEEKGELMLVHRCIGCVKLSLNRIAADDDPEEVLKLLKLPQQENVLAEIDILTESNKQEVRKQLFGS